MEKRNIKEQELKMENLQVGMAVKNYKEMCKILGVRERATGNSRNSQMKEWERHFKWRKEGHKFIIEEIYICTQPKQDGRTQGNNTIYSEDIQTLLLYFLSNNDSGDVCWSCSSLLKELSMVNTNYTSERKNIPKLSEKINIKEDYIYDFYNNTQRNLKQKLETSLNALERKALINWQKVMMLCKESIHIETNEFGTPQLVNGKLSYKKHIIYEKASKAEMDRIRDVERETILAMGFRDKKDIFLNGQWVQFTTNVNKSLREKGNITFYYEAYEIIYTPYYVKDEFADVINIKTTEDKLNKKIVESLYIGAETRHKNIAEKVIGLERPLSSNEKLKINFDYAFNNKQLINHLIATTSNTLLS